MAATPESILANIDKFVTSQGNQAGLEGLAKILKDLVDLASGGPS